MCDYWEARRRRKCQKLNGLPIWVAARLVRRSKSAGRKGHGSPLAARLSLSIRTRRPADHAYMSRLAGAGFGGVAVLAGALVMRSGRR
jgi:hypothetical protein